MSITCSQFNYFYSEDGSFALWNTLSGRFVRLPPGVYHALKSGELSSLDRTEVAALKNVGALVDDSTNELAIFESMEARQRNEAPQKYRILTTTACNAHCSYCYEKGTALSSMNPDIAEKTAGLIIRNHRTQPTDIVLEWFGGEPLINPGPITRICGRLTEAGVPFVSNITTNGLLLDEWLLSCCDDWHLCALQITMDGLDEQYERIKAVPPGSFERLTGNIRAALEKGLRVKIRINESGDIESEKLLIRRLKELFGGEPLLSVYISPLYRSGKDVDRERMERVLSLEQELFHCGFAQENNFYCFRTRFTRCFACNGGFTVFPDGQLFNCSHHFEKDGRIGTLDMPESGAENRKKYTEAVLSEGCRSCIFLPLCAGGCRSAELGLAEMNQCFPYKSVMDKVASLRLKYAEDLIKDNRFKTRLSSQCGESMLDKEKSKKSLSYEEAALEIQEKASQLLKLLEGGSNMQKSLGKFCPKCSAPLNPDMLFCYRCGAKVSGNTKLPEKEKKVDLTGWGASREFLIEVANRVFEPDEEPYMGEYSGEENRIAAVMEMLKALLTHPCTLVQSKWGDNYDGLSAVKGKLEWLETVDDFSCDGCYDGGCGGPGYYTLTSFIEKISPEEYAKERSSAVASGLAIESTVVGERFTINNDDSDTVRRTTYMKNFQKLSGYYRCYVVHDR